jgi:hypothetical protein
MWCEGRFGGRGVLRAHNIFVLKSVGHLHMGR